MQFDPTISVGNLFEAVAVVAFLGAAIWRLRVLEKKVDKLDDTVAILARQDERIKHLEDDIRDLKRGRGFILEPGFAGRFDRRPDGGEYGDR